MIFTLTYDGPLSGSHRSASAKHHIRQALHPQLKALWRSEPLVSRKDSIDPGATGELLADVAGHGFAPLVHDHHHLRAKLQILMLRRDAPGGGIIHGGDIDNRLKTLLDGLQRPQHPQEIPSGWQPNEDERPLFCLLDDDRLVTRVDVDTARWLEPGDHEHVRLVITVNIWSPQMTYWSMGIAG
ncbi:hypothetical protein ACQEVZ_20460 [Dactylosporangium sp. CA-152071]|uniref:hypothetical protein n=1 Tax=Dactylosporangium sp. CA-152071 TaxID=3239933 RepID=UPI003D94CA74